MLLKITIASLPQPLYQGEWWRWLAVGAGKVWPEEKCAGVLSLTPEFFLRTVKSCQTLPRVAASLLQWVRCIQMARTFRFPNRVFFELAFFGCGRSI